jgi:hypothetical protein
MMVAKVRRVANPNRKPVRSRAKVNPSRKSKAGGRKRLSAKQIKFFGTKRQKAALKRKRRTSGTVRAKANPGRTHKRRTAKRTVKRSAAPVVVVVSKAKSTRRRRPVKRNPIQAVTLGFLNPHKGRKVMAKRRKRHASASPVRRVVRRRRKSNPSGRRRRATRSVMVVRRNSRKRYGMKRNPNFFGSSVSTIEMVKYIGGGLAGVAVTKAAVPMLPESLRGSQAMVVASSIGIAFAAGWAASKVDAKIGSAVLFGGLMQAASVFLNSFVPTVGRIVGLQGGRGVGEFVPARFTVPQNPILANGAGGGAAVAGRAYQPAY